ncbi:unnamed protein product [Cuscuta campestris]|uniref:Putative plant transposon protein domain-containing protein n=1 Tax=Cuscuta campestris TaxID=132261 RepID=A0A484LZH2_9ASTE|nr:unnamed protein product [Cuscuta campestris]
MGDMEEGANVQRPPLLRGHNYNFWKGRMRAFLKSLGGGVWRSVETGWTEPRKYSDDLTTSRIKPFEEYSRTEVTAAEFNDKALNAIFRAADSTQYKLISNCDNAKEAWDILEVTHEGDEEVKTAKYQILMTQYENLRMDEKEKITKFHGRVRDIANQAARLNEPIPENKLVLKAAEEDEENLPQPNLEESSMEQPDSRSVDAEVRKDTEDDVIPHPVATIPETLYLEHTVTQQEENMQSKKKEDLQSQKEIPEIVDEEPLLACSDVPFEDVQFTTPASKKAMTKRTGSRWSLRQKAKENQESEGIEEIQTKEVKKKELKRKEKTTDDQEESSKKQKTSSPLAKHTIRSQINQRKNAKAEKSPKPGKFSKHLFVSSITSSYMSEIAKKTILLQRSIDVEDFEAKTNLIPVLKKCNLLKSITLPGSYVRKVIQEFYCNLSEGCNIHTNSSYHKVFVREKTFDLSPTKINQFLNIKPPSSEINVNERQVWTDLTNGERISQSTKSKMPSSILKSSYAILFRVAAYHWLPTTHMNTVPLCIATLIYKIKHEIPVNLGKIIFDQIMSFASERAKQNSNGLPYPLLIYQMLKSQKLVVADEEEPAPPLLQGGKPKQDESDDAATQGEQSEDDEATEEGEDNADAEDDNLANEESDFEAELHNYASALLLLGFTTTVTSSSRYARGQPPSKLAELRRSIVVGRRSLVVSALVH